MKKILITFILVLLLVSFVSASITFETQPHSVYNLGDKINTIIVFSPNPEFNEVVSINLKCGDNKVQVYKEFLSLTEETKKSITIPLLKPLIGTLFGNCELGVYSGDNLEVSSENFKVSNLIKVETVNLKDSFTPGEEFTIQGSAIKENGENVEGVYSAVLDNNSFNGEVKNGDFNFVFLSPNDFFAGNHKLVLNVTEKNSAGEILNSGEKISFLSVPHVPNSIEIILDKNEVLPGSDLFGKVVLHDQTGESIPDEEVYIAIKNGAGEIIKKIITKTETNFIYSVEKNQIPATFQISFYSKDIISNSEFKVLENREVSSEIINRTLTLTNTGNVFYEGDLILQIGLDNVTIPLTLPVGESEIYIISAPDGDYDVVVGDLKRRISLSGNVVQVEKVSQSNSSFTIFIWAFVLIVLALGVYLVFKKGHRPHFFVRAKNKKNLKKISEVPKVVEDSQVFDSKKKIELSLSIVGTKQNATVGCISIKNYPEISSGKGNVKETFLEIESLVESNKGFVYQNGSFLFFIFAPAITKTFKNQKAGVLILQKVKKILDEHNKKFKQRIEFGISLNYGTIITKVEPKNIKFMSLGTLMIESKKFSGHSEGEIIVSEKLIHNMEEKVKGELVNVGSLKGYKLETLVDKDSHSTFLKGFIARQERDRAKEQEKQDKRDKN
ncbi:hypothetical protein GW931_03890 [archaeon]|nr:hypothetical protein [archaeon]